MSSRRPPKRHPSLVTAPVLFALFATCGPGCAPPAEDPSGSQRGRGPVSGAKGPSQEDATAEADRAPPKPGEMIMEAKGVDLSKLTEAQRTTFFQLINTEPSACDKPHSLATSLRDDDKCRDSLVASQYIADRLAAGATVGDVKAELVEVLDSLEVRDIPIEGRPVYGNERAPVTVVVFADFECPHCRSEAPVLRQAVQQFRGQAKLVYKHFPLSMHPRAKAASVATEAAHAQGKFWAMHDQVFAHQTQLEDEDLLRYARAAGLDMEKFKADYQAEKYKKVVEEDRKHGDDLEIEGTPAVFVNGREFNQRLFGGTVEGWIDDALRR